MKLPENPPTPPEGHYWCDKDDDVNLRKIGEKPGSGSDLVAWVDLGYAAPGVYEAKYCYNEQPMAWPRIQTNSLEEAMNWIVAAVILDIRKE